MAITGGASVAPGVAVRLGTPAARPRLRAGTQHLLRLIGEDLNVAAKLLLIVDDHAQFGSFVRQMLDGHEFHVVGVAANGEDALDAVLALAPEVVLLDVQLPGIDGFEVAERLAAGPSPPRVVMTSTRDPSDFGTRLSTAPVVGFVPKQSLSVAALSKLLRGRDSR